MRPQKRYVLRVVAAQTTHRSMCRNETFVCWMWIHYGGMMHMGMCKCLRRRKMPYEWISVYFPSWMCSLTCVVRCSCVSTRNEFMFERQHDQRTFSLSLSLSPSLSLMCRLVVVTLICLYAPAHSMHRNGLLFCCFLTARAIWYWEIETNKIVINLYIYIHCSLSPS